MLNCAAIIVIIICSALLAGKPQHVVRIIDSINKQTTNSNFANKLLSVKSVLY